MVGYGIPQNDICKVTLDKNGKPISKPTLEKHFRHEIDTGAVVANSKVVESLYQQAVGRPAEYDAAGNVRRAESHPNVTAQIWWTKGRMGWSEKADIAHEVKGGVMQVPVAPDPEAWAKAAADYQRQLMHDSSGAANGEAKPNGHA